MPVFLSDWMKEERYTDAKFIDKINEILRRDQRKTYTWRAVKPWRDGDVVPRPGVVGAIHELTMGKVGYPDFVAASSVKRAAS